MFMDMRIRIVDSGFYEYVAINLRNRIKSLKLTEAQVARACGLSERRFGHYVNGTREPDLLTFLTISSVLNTTPDALLLGHGAEAKLPKDHVLARFEYVARQLSCEDIEIIVEQAKALLQCRKNRKDHLVKCSEQDKSLCFKKFKQPIYESSVCGCGKSVKDDGSNSRMPK